MGFIIGIIIGAIFGYYFACYLMQNYMEKKQFYEMAMKYMDIDPEKIALEKEIKSQNSYIAYLHKTVIAYRYFIREHLWELSPRTEEEYRWMKSEIDQLEKFESGPSQD